MRQNQNLLSWLMLSILVALIPACEKEDPYKDLPLDYTNNLKKVVTISVPDSSIVISSAKAREIAVRYLNQQPARTRNASDISQVTLYSSSQGEPVFYAVNFSNNGGFVLLSATKHSYPIIAYSNNGNFRLNRENSGLKSWIKEISQKIISSRDDSTSLEKYSQTWLSLASNQVAFSRTRFIEEEQLSPEIESYIINQVFEWQIAGYQVFRLVDWVEQNGLGFTPFENKIREIYTSEDVSPFTNRKIYKDTYILVKTEESTPAETVMPLLKTQWGQGYPYNNSIVNHYPAGCVAIALSQTINYFATIPNQTCGYSYNFSLLNSGTDSGNVELARFVSDMGKLIDTNYGPYGSGATTSIVPSKLRLLGYSCGDLISYSKSETMQSLRNGSPVIMRGANNNVELIITMRGMHGYVMDSKNPVT